MAEIKKRNGKMKIKATMDAWYQKKKIREGQIVDYKGPDVPCWGTLADGAVFEAEDEDNENLNPDDDDEQDDETEGEGEQEPDVDNDDSLNETLEVLRDLAVENDIWVELPDNCTAQEEIELLRKEFIAKNVKINF